MEPEQNEVTQLLLAWSAGDKDALNELMPIVYQELRRVAHFQLAKERKGHTLQTTALVNEAYLKLIGQKQGSVAESFSFLCHRCDGYAAHPC